MLHGKTVLLITDSCYPNLSMNGVIAMNIAEVLQRHNNNIFILSLKQSNDDAVIAFNNKVSYIKSFSYYEGTLVKKAHNSLRKVTKNFYSVINFCVRAISISLRLLSKRGLNELLVKAFIVKIKGILNEESIDYVLCFSYPYEPAVAILNLVDKHKNVKFMLYQLDDFVTALDFYYPKILLKKREYYRSILVKQWTEKLHKYRMLYSVYNKEKNYVDQAIVKSIGFPLIKKKREEKHSFSDVVKITYTGSLSIASRSPMLVLEILKEVQSRIKIAVNFYHKGDCDTVIDRYSDFSIFNRGSVSIEEAYKAMSSSDILLAISTHAGDQISGKTFDYISTGKPIIFFYYKENDMNLKIYENYDLFLSVKISDKRSDKRIEECVKSVVNFINENRQKRIPFSRIADRYSAFIPEAVAIDFFEK